MQRVGIMLKKNENTKKLEHYPKKNFKYFLMKSTNDKDLFGHKSSYLKWKGIIWNEIESFGVKTNEKKLKECAYKKCPPP